MRRLAQTKTFVVLATCLLYYALDALGQWAMHSIGNANYGTPAMLPWIFHIQLVMVLLLVYVTRRCFIPEEVGLGAVRGNKHWIEMTLVITPIAIGAILMIIWLSRLSPEGWAQIDKGVLLTGILGIGLVGISEEWMFRGLILHHFSTIKEWNASISRGWEHLLKRGLVRHDWSGTVNKAIGIGVSAALFSLLHATNFFGGYSPSAVSYQLIGTFAYGVVFGVLAFRLPSIRSLMAWHFLWDYSMIIGGYLVSSGLST